jgi:hypothetical protein
MKDSALYNEDLAPVTEDQRTWSMWTIAALWVGMVVCITTYNLASGMIAKGMSWAQALVHDRAREFDRVCPDGAECACRAQNTASHFRCCCALRSAREGRIFPPSCEGWLPADGSEFRRGSAAARFTLFMHRIFGFEPATEADYLPVLGISARTIRVLSPLLGSECFLRLVRHEIN